MYVSPGPRNSGSWRLFSRGFLLLFTLCRDHHPEPRPDFPSRAFFEAAADRQAYFASFTSAERLSFELNFPDMPHSIDHALGSPDFREQAFGKVVHERLDQLKAWRHRDPLRPKKRKRITFKAGMTTGALLIKKVHPTPSMGPPKLLSWTLVPDLSTLIANFPIDEAPFTDVDNVITANYDEWVAVKTSFEEERQAPVGED